ncbi:hypothetical protein B0H14DRAFT_2709652 [Mycena olivaceomarginata]|nr:hypothetical protein B0H14DRAFT_2709652 [Mycena olivaceomarginata]
MASSTQPQACPRCLTPFDALIDATKPSRVPRDILNTNRPPTDLEILCIQSAIVDKRAQKMRLVAPIEAVQLLLYELSADCESLCEEIETHKATLSPIRRMPPELLSLIFACASQPTLHDRRDTAPWAASQVSRRWRAIALSQPSLWTSIDLDFGWIKDGQTRTIYRLEAHLKRSGNLPLDIDFGCRVPFRTSERELALLNVLTRHSARWETIRINGSLSLSSALVGIRGNLPLLRKLQVLFYPHGPADQPSVNLDVFGLAPNLREAYVNLEGNRQVAIVLPFSGLTRYAAHSTWNGHLRALRSAHNLVDCALQLDGPISIPPTTLVTLPHLLRLSLRDSNLLDCLDAPQLEELYCSSTSNHLSSLFHRRQPPRLKKLVLFFPASVTDLCSVLRSVPTITDLGVSVSEKSVDALSNSLTLRNEPTDITLALRCIIISTDNRAIVVPDYDDRILANMVASRWRSGQLRSITVPETWVGSAHTQWEILKQDGLALTFDRGDWDLSLSDMVPHHLRLNDSN